MYVCIIGSVIMNIQFYWVNKKRNNSVHPLQFKPLFKGIQWG